MRSRPREDNTRQIEDIPQMLQGSAQSLIIQRNTINDSLHTLREYFSESFVEFGIGVRSWDRLYDEFLFGGEEGFEGVFEPWFEVFCEVEEEGGVGGWFGFKGGC